MNSQQAIQAALKDGEVMIDEGTYLHTCENIQAEQASWNDFDECKQFDFSGALFWIVGDAGVEPLAISGADDEDLIAILN
jgi:hypothetical protein